MSPTAQQRHVAFLALAITLATFIAALGGTAFQRKVESFQPLGFDAELRDGTLWVTELSRPRVGVQPGDGIVLIGEDGGGEARIADLGRLREVLRQRAESRILVLRAGSAGPEMAAVTYHRPPLEVDFTYLILAAIGTVYLLIGLYTAFKDRQVQARLFLLWCLASTALYVLSPPLQVADFTDELIYLVDQLARTLLPALTLHLFLIFPSPLLERRWLIRLVPALYLPAALALTFHLDQIYGGQQIFGPAAERSLALVDRLEFLFVVLSGLLGALMLLVRFSQQAVWEHRRQVQWVLFGLLGGYVPFLLFFAVPWSLDLAWPRWTAIAGVLPLALVPLGFAWAILKHKLLDIGVILRDSISYSLTVLIGLSGFSLINLAIRSGVSEDLALARNFLTFAAGVLIAGVLAPARSVISSSLERLQYRGTLHQRRELTDLGRELLHERDLDKLCAVLTERLADGLVAHVRLYLAQGGGMVPVDPRPDLPRELSFAAFGPGFWERDVAPITAGYLPAERPTVRERLYLAGFRYAFPLTVRHHRIGVVLVSYKFDDEPLNSEDLELARNFLHQASLAIENARLLEEVHRKLQEVIRLEEHNQGILESSPAGIAVLDEDDRIVSANHAFAAIAGVARPRVLGKSLETLVGIAPLPAPEDGLIEVSFCDLAGEERYLQLSMASYRGDDDTLRVLVVQDVTERVAMKHALQEKERLASLGMLAAGVAHEVNTPLTGISSYAQMLMAEVGEDDPHYEILKKMERQTFRAAQIVNNLLEFARNRRDELVPVDVGAVLDEAVGLLAERAARAGVEIDWQRPPAEDAAPILGHEGELHQVFTNVLVNALEAMPDGGRITVRQGEVDRRVRVTVADTGPGIPAARLERIFDPFFSSKMSHGGSGLGLAITYNIVRRHGGEIRVENRADGSGCIFTIELPRHRNR